MQSAAVSSYIADKCYTFQMKALQIIKYTQRERERDGETTVLLEIINVKWIEVQKRDGNCVRAKRMKNKNPDIN